MSANTLSQAEPDPILRDFALFGWAARDHGLDHSTDGRPE